MGVNSLTRDTLNSTVKYTSALAGNSIYDVSSMVPIATATLTSNGSFTFNSIPQGYQDLFLAGTLRSSNSGGDGITVYSVYGTNDYSSVTMLGNGTSVDNSRQTNAYTVTGWTYIASASNTAGIFSAVNITIPNYSSTSINKTFLVRISNDTNGSGNVTITAGLRRNTSAITTLTIGGANAALVAGSSMTLYGIKAVGQ